MNIGILSIGDEVVMGKTINTNASYLAKKLQEKHFKITEHLCIRDERKDILSALFYLYRNAQVLITTGGLGPSQDDITKEVVAEFFNEQLMLNQSVIDQIKHMFMMQKQEMPVTNIKQAYFIEDSLIVENHNGTAPGMIYEKEGRIIILLPGPPNELEPMFESDVLPYLINRYQLQSLEKKYRLMNIGESKAEVLLESLYQQYPQFKIAPYASVGVVDYIISSHNINDKKLFNEACSAFEDIMKDYIVGDTTKEINEIVIESLGLHKLTLACAESCTGGMVSSYLVDVPGGSTVFLEGIVAYSNEAKVNHLNIDPQIIKAYGAVSKEVAIEMAKNIAQISQADIGVSTTGIAGPSGGTKEKPVGLVYMAIHYKGQTRVYEQYFSGNRDKVRKRTTMFLLYQLYKEIIKTL